MMRFVMPIILIGLGITIFFVFSNPLYTEVLQLRTQMASYDEALNNSKVLENERDKLTAKYNSIDPVNLTKLEKLLPENINNIRLILEIEKIASPYNMALKDVKYNTMNDDATVTPSGITAGGGVSVSSSKDYGVWDLEFSTSGTYNNFLNFTKDLESNLRIVDISSIEFSSSTTTSNTTLATVNDIYKYNFKIKTYWLKN